MLWLLNGAAMYVLLFSTDQWHRLVPTTWEVIPNAASTALQYLSLTFPEDHSWTRYNSLQQLAHLLTVLVAAPTSVVTGLLAWEAAQIPFYTLWRTGSVREVAFAAIHCTGGGLLMGGASLAGGLLLFGAPGWPRSRFLPVAAAAVAFGLGFTVLIERAATAWGLWTYSNLMPVLSGLGTRLAPLAQWIAVPALAFAAPRLPLGSKPQPLPAQEARDRPATASTASAAEPDHVARTTWRAS